MNNVSKTMYIPLYGKCQVSKKGIILKDKKAEEIWTAEGFDLKGKSKSKWLAYYMGMRSAVMDQWLDRKLHENDDALVIHLGCGLDSRIYRVGNQNHQWYDVDFPDVIEERKKYFPKFEEYHMIGADIRNNQWISKLPYKPAVVVMEGVSMYLTIQELKSLLERLNGHFEQISLLMDCYTDFAAKVSKYKNPINDVGVTKVYGMNEPKVLETEMLKFVKKHEITPKNLIDELNGTEKMIFQKLYAGSFSDKLYRMYEFKK